MTEPEITTVMRAFGAGKQLQVKQEGSSAWKFYKFKNLLDLINTIGKGNAVRVTPEPEYRPWLMAEVPFGVRYSRNGVVGHLLPLSIDTYGICFMDATDTLRRVTYEELFKDYCYTSDGTTWHPCRAALLVHVI